RATGRISMSWQLPGVKKPWAYDVTAQLREVEQPDGEQTWQPEWQPSLVQPDLVPGARLDVSRKQPERGMIIGADDQELVKPRAVSRIGIDKTRVSGKAALESAAELAELVDIDSDAYVKRVKAAGEKAFVEAIVYRQSDP